MYTLILLCTVQHHTCAYIHMGNIDIVTLTAREATYKYGRFQHDMLSCHYSKGKSLPEQNEIPCNQFHCKGALFIVRFIESLNTHVLHQFPFPGILKSGHVGFAFGFHSHTFAKCFDFWSRKNERYGIITA